MANEKRLIDANALCENIKKRYCEQCKAQGKDYKEVVCRACDIDDMRIEIEDAPTVEAVEVVRGKWKNSDFIPGMLTCTNCGAQRNPKFKIGGGEWNYCPNCGAKMDGERREGE